MCRYRLPENLILRASSVFLLVLAACGRDIKPKVADSASTAVTSGNAARPSAPGTGWDENSAGQFMVLAAADDEISAVLVLPEETDSTLGKAGTFNIDKFENASVDLFGLNGTAGKSTLAFNQQQPSAEGCLTWPAIRLTTKPALSWKVGFASGRASAVQIDSVEKLGLSDSLLITTELIKQASTLSLKGDSSYQGLPFVIEDAYRLAMGDTTVLLGSIVRKINEEANPREEHLLLVLEKDGASGNYSVAFQSRSAGSEDVVRTNSILAAVKFVRTGQVAVAISFEYDDGGQVALLQRTAPLSWRITWRSAYTGC